MEDLVVYVSLILSVLTGGIVVLFIPLKNQNPLKLLLAFSGAFLLAVSFLHLIPEVYESGPVNIGLYVLLGFLFQLLLEFFSDGVEHGHMHKHDHSRERAFPVIIMISLSIHAFVEGIPLEREIHHEYHSVHDHSNHSLLLGVVFHNIPVSIALMSMFLHSGLSKQKSLFWLFVFALTGPLGTLTGHYFGAEINTVIDDFLDITLAIVVGMFMHISTTILFESAEGHRFNVMKLTAIILGALVAMVNL